MKLDELCSVLALHLSQMFLSLPLDELAIDLGCILEEKKAVSPLRARLYSVVQYSYYVLSPVLSKARLDQHMHKNRNPHKGSRHSVLQCAVSPDAHADCVIMWQCMHSQRIRLNPSIIQSTRSSCENTLFLFSKHLSDPWPFAEGIARQEILCP